MRGTALRIVVGLVGAVASQPSFVMAAPNCHCRAADGRSVEVGQEACLKGKLARCEMFLNNTSWKLTGEACPQSQLAPALRLQFAAQRATLPVCKAS